MARIKIIDLPRNRQITREEMEKVVGGSARGVMRALRNIYDTGSDIIQSFHSMQMSAARSLRGDSADDSGSDSGGGSSSGWKPDLDTYESSNTR
jgi:hypothetical protein